MHNFFVEVSVRGGLGALKGEAPMMVFGSRKSDQNEGRLLFVCIFIVWVCKRALRNISVWGLQVFGLKVLGSFQLVCFVMRSAILCKMFL